jgi:hypothetical protein
MKPPSLLLFHRSFLLPLDMPGDAENEVNSYGEGAKNDITG